MKISIQNGSFRLNFKLIAIVFALILLIFINRYFQVDGNCNQFINVKTINIISQNQDILPKQIYQCGVSNEASEYSNESALIKDILPRVAGLGLVISSVHQSSDFLKRENNNQSSLWPLEISTSSKSNYNLNIFVSYDDPLAYKINVIKNKLEYTIGYALLASEGHFERGLIKAYVKSKIVEDQYEPLQVIQESIVDLIYYYVYGHFKLFDPLSKTTTRLGQFFWPQVLKDKKNYCDSPWRYSEDFSMCSDFNQSSIDQLDKNKFFKLSLRPLITSSLIKVFNQKSTSWKTSTMRDLLFHLNQLEFSSDQKIDLALNQSQLPMMSLELFSVFSEVLNHNHGSSYLNDLKINFINELGQRGIQNSIADFNVDFLIEISDLLSEKNNLLSEVYELALEDIKNTNSENTHVQVTTQMGSQTQSESSQMKWAVRDPEYTWIMPSRTPIKNSMIENLKSFQTIYFACPVLKNIKYQELAQNSFKFLILKSCQNQKKYYFEYLKYSIKDFTMFYSNVSLLQIYSNGYLQDLSPLNLKTESLDLFELVQQRDSASEIFNILAWQSVDWDEKFKIYRPRSHKAIIEFFR